MLFRRLLFEMLFVCLRQERWQRCRHLIGYVSGAQHGCRHDIDMVNWLFSSWFSRTAKLFVHEVIQGGDLKKLARVAKEKEGAREGRKCAPPPSWCRPAYASTSRRCLFKLKKTPPNRLFRGFVPKGVKPPIELPVIANTGYSNYR